MSLGIHFSIAGTLSENGYKQRIDFNPLFLILAGNYGEDACKYSPGSTPGAITVGAIDRDDSVSYYSNFGKCVDMYVNSEKKKLYANCKYKVLRQVQIFFRYGQLPTQLHIP